MMMRSVRQAHRTGVQGRVPGRRIHRWRCQVDEQAERDLTEYVAQRTHTLFRMAYALTGDQHAAGDLLQNAPGEDGPALGAHQR